MKRIGVVGHVSLPLSSRRSTHSPFHSYHSYCLGGEVSTLLAGTQPLTDAESLPNVNLVDVVVTAHPSFLNTSDFQSIRVPFALICAQGESAPPRAFCPPRARSLPLGPRPLAEDFAFDGIRKEALAVLDNLPASVPTAVLDDHPGTVHGASVTPPRRRLCRRS